VRQLLQQQLGVWCSKRAAAGLLLLLRALLRECCDGIIVSVR
jgi:hypothetical protein